MKEISIEIGRWYRYYKPDGTTIELKAMSGNTYIGRDGKSYDMSVIRELHSDEQPEALEDDLDWPK